LTLRVCEPVGQFAVQTVGFVCAEKLPSPVQE